MLVRQRYSKPHLLKVITAIAELQGLAWLTAYFPELVLDSPVMWSGHTVGRMFQTMPQATLPQSNVDGSIVLHNQRDLLFLKHHIS